MDSLTPDLLAALTDTFPGGFIRLDGIRTIGGYFCLHIPGKGYIWYLPDRNQFTKVGNSLFDEERLKMTLLPDPTHEPTFHALLLFLAERTGTPADQGLRWYPHTRGKAVVGWCLQGRGSAKTFQGISSTEPRLALLQTLAMLKCCCADRGKIECPVHGPHKRWS